MFSSDPSNNISVSILDRCIQPIRSRLTYLPHLPYPQYPHDNDELNTRWMVRRWLVSLGNPMRSWSLERRVFCSAYVHCTRSWSKGRRRLEPRDTTWCINPFSLGRLGLTWLFFHDRMYVYTIPCTLFKRWLLYFLHAGDLGISASVLRNYMESAPALSLRYCMYGE